MRQRTYGLQSPNYLLSGSLQIRFADSCLMPCNFPGSLESLQSFPCPCARASGLKPRPPPVCQAVCPGAGSPGEGTFTHLFTWSVHPLFMGRKLLAVVPNAQFPFPPHHSPWEGSPKACPIRSATEGVDSEGGEQAGVGVCMKPEGGRGDGLGTSWGF